MKECFTLTALKISNPNLNFWYFRFETDHYWYIYKLLTSDKGVVRSPLTAFFTPYLSDNGSTWKSNQNSYLFRFDACSSLQKLHRSFNDIKKGHFRPTLSTQYFSSHVITSPSFLFFFYDRFTDADKLILSKTSDWPMWRKYRSWR